MEDTWQVAPFLQKLINLNKEVRSTCLEMYRQSLSEMPYHVSKFENTPSVCTRVY